MRILHVIFAGRFTEKLSYQENLLPRYHATDGHEVIILTTCYMSDINNKPLYTPPIDEKMSDGIRLVRMDFSKIINKFITRKIRKVNGTLQFITLLKPDIIFFHGTQSIELLNIARYAKRNREVKIFVDNHADYINSARNWISKYLGHKIIWKYCAKNIEPFVVRFYGVLPLRCDFLREVYKISNDKIELLEMGADSDRILFSQKMQIRQKIRTELMISENDFVLITGGIINENKKIHLLIQAVNELELLNVKLIIFGSLDTQMRTTIENLSKSKYIRNIGWIDSAKIYDYFMASDLAVFPGTHSVLWEQSVGTGLPGVFKFWEGMDHLDLGGNCKYLYSDSITEIKNVLREIISDKIEFEKMKEVAEEIGVKKFSYREISRRAIQF